MLKICRVVSKTDPVQVASTKSQTGTTTKQSLVLQEVDGRFGDTFVVTCIGQDLSNINTGNVVTAGMQFTVNEYNGNNYQDILLREIHRL